MCLAGYLARLCYCTPRVDGKQPILSVCTACNLVSGGGARRRSSSGWHQTGGLCCGRTRPALP
eukprot:13965356-Alexandrium_andersonii.AAC.1